jgi:hypothetical protein
MKPKECINSNCNRVFYVPRYLIHLCLQCQTCIDKKDNLNFDFNSHEELIIKTN